MAMSTLSASIAFMELRVASSQDTICTGGAHTNHIYRIEHAIDRSE